MKKLNNIKCDDIQDDIQIEYKKEQEENLHGPEHYHDAY